MMLFLYGGYVRSKSIAFSQLNYLTLFHRRLLGKLDKAQIAVMFYTDGKEEANIAPKCSMK